jgi:alpha-glucoside transport system substrate-binding protein
MIGPDKPEVTMSRIGWKPTATAGILASAMLLAACSSSGSPAVQPAPSASGGLVAAAEAAARTAADGQHPGGTIHILGELTGAQLTAYLGTLKPFTAATGIQVQYESTANLFAVLQTDVAGGSPPDIVSDPSAGQIVQLADEGKVVPIDSWLNMGQVNTDFPSGLVSLASVKGHLYGLFYNTSVQNLVWYDPQTYTGPNPPTSWAQLESWAATQAAAGHTPWCIGMASGSASGWPGAAWIEQFVLRQSGVNVYDQWWEGKLPWSSPQVKAAFQAFGAVATNAKTVFGGPTSVLTTSFSTSPNGLFTKPAQCSLTVQADWLGDTEAQTVPGVKPVTDIDFFTFPAVTPADAGIIETSGELVAALRDTPQTQDYMRYLATPQFADMVAQTGQWLAANRTVAPSSYSAALEQQADKVYENAASVRYSAQASMPLAMETAFFSAVLDYVKDPGSLDSILAGMDRTQATAYANF